MAKLLQSTLFQSKGALMIKAKRNKPLSLLLVAAMVIMLLPVGAFTAFAAASTISPLTASSSYKVVKGVTGAYVKNQAAANITIEEDSGKESWGAGDKTVTLTLEDTTNIDFSAKPTVTLNGSASNVTSVSNTSDTVTIHVSGNDSVRDKIIVSDIKYNVGPTSATTVNVTVTDPSGDTAQTAKNAQVKDGVILSASGTLPTHDVGTTDKLLALLTVSESGAGIATSSSVITVTLPEGISFYEPPVATATNMDLTIYT
ncbi:MAG: hypothetical protein HY779_03305, partial [Rubrobacteridae bacterium]|nr:hypothetical protein [Rubrobacteridae bacterium]